MTVGEKTPVFPLIQHLSMLATPALARMPVTANQITATSLATGLAASWCLLQGGGGWAAAGVLFVVTYVLDNCDGEIARLKDQCSTFGMWFDTLVDWIVHTAFFIALGIGMAKGFGHDAWLWLGGIATAGGTFNFALGIILDARDKAASEDEDKAETTRQPEGLSDWAVYVFRELTRADFCFIVLALALFDLTWLLLPAGAICSQVYWIAQFVRGARELNV